MKPIYHEVKTQNGIPTLSKAEIKRLIFMNPMREKPLTAENITHALESLKQVYAKHTGREKPEKKEMPPGAIIGPPCPVCTEEFYLRTGICLTCINCAHSSSCG